MTEPTRYMNHAGAMVPDPDGQWLHVGDVTGTKEWNLDPAFAASQPPSGDALREAAQAAADFLGTSSWEEPDDEQRAWAVLDSLNAALATPAPLDVERLAEALRPVTRELLHHPSDPNGAKWRRLTAEQIVRAYANQEGGEPREGG